MIQEEPLPERKWSRADIERDFPGLTSLRELLKSATFFVEKMGEVVCEIRVNGMVLSEEEEHKFHQTSTASIESLCIKSERPSVLLDKSLVECRLFLDRLIEALEKCQVLFRCEDLHEAHEFHKECIKGAENFITIIRHYKGAYQALRGSLSSSWIALEGAMLNCLKEIYEAYSKKNYILVADLLEYDLANIFLSWKQQLLQLETKIRGDRDLGL